MRKIRKTFTAMLVVLGIISGTMVSGAALEAGSALTPEKSHALSEALQAASVYIDDIDLASLRVGQPIQTYEYVDQSFLEGIVMYPLTRDGELVLLAIENGAHFQITDALVDEISEAVDGTSRFSIVYDSKNCYLYVNNGFILLCENVEEATNRDVLDVSGGLNGHILSTTELTDLIEWEFEEAPFVRVQSYYSLPVSYVKQLYSKTCWAASIAMIVNYINGTNLTDVLVARNVYSWENFNYYLARDKVPSVLALYDVTYTYKNQVPSDNVILRNIKNGYPIYASFNVVETNTGHAGVIYAVHVMAGYMYVMDPVIGATLLSYDTNRGSYVYADPTCGNTLVLACASAHDWS